MYLLATTAPDTFLFKLFPLYMLIYCRIFAESKYCPYSDAAVGALQGRTAHLRPRAPVRRALTRLFLSFYINNLVQTTVIGARSAAPGTDAEQSAARFYLTGSG